MKRRSATSGVTLDDVPDWVLHFFPDRYLHLMPAVVAELDPRPVQGCTSPIWPVGMRWAMEAHRLHWDESRAWLAEHAPHLTYRELRLEERRRFPVVDPVRR